MFVTIELMRKLGQSLILISFFIVLSAPVILLSQDLTIRKSADFLFFLQRASGLYSFSLIFIAIIMGSAMNVVDRFFPADKVFSFHKIVGKTAFVLAILHPVFLYGTYFLVGNLSYILPFQQGSSIIYYSLGILALLLLIVTVAAALARFRIGIKWLYIHRLNYLIFWLIFFHGLNLGVDTQTSFARFLFITYGVIVAILTIRKILIYRI